MPDVTPQLPSVFWRAALAALGRLPQGAMSRAFGGMADLPVPPPMRRPLYGLFAKAVGADLAEAELPLDKFPTLNAFFVRRLKAGVHVWPQDPSLITSPVDGIVGQAGEINKGHLVQAKGHKYSAAALLAEPAEAERFTGGRFVTLYLSPRHYHRIHAPANGSIALARHVPGALLPVNTPAVLHVPGLFARNERLLCYIDSDAGRTAVVAVGAYNVGRISARFDPHWSGTGAPGDESAAAHVTNRAARRGRVRRYDPPVRVRRGEEIMAFHLGSTVVLLFEPDGVELAPAVVPGAEVRVGQEIARPLP